MLEMGDGGYGAPVMSLMESQAKLCWWRRRVIAHTGQEIVITPLTRMESPSSEGNLRKNGSNAYATGVGAKTAWQTDSCKRHRVD